MAGRNVQVDFLGHPAPFPQGPWLLAGLLMPGQFTVLPKAREGRYRVILEPFADAVLWRRSDRQQVIADWATRYAERLGHYCLEAPQQWFNFYPFWKADDDATP